MRTGRTATAIRLRMRLAPAVRIVLEPLPLHAHDTETLAGRRAHHHPSLEPFVDGRAELLEPRNLRGDIVGLDVEMDSALMLDALDLDADLAGRSFEHHIIATGSGMVWVDRTSQRLRPEARRCADVVDVAVD